MKIFLGHRALEFNEGVTLMDVVGPREADKLQGIWVNGIQVPVCQFAVYKLQDGDRIKVQRIVCAG